MAKAPLSTSALRVVWAPPCSTRSATYTFRAGGVTVTCDPRVVPALAAMDAIFVKWGYVLRKTDTGMFVCRRITNGTGYSLHAYKIAIDCNWQSNPYFPYPVSYQGHCDMPIGMVNEIVGLRTVSGAPVWGWGGYYQSIRDFMHYEIVCTPADLATGIVGTAGLPPLTAAEKRALKRRAWREAARKPFLYPGVEKDHPERIPYIKQAQQNLGLPVTGNYGHRTWAKVKDLQETFGIKYKGKPGRINRRMWAALIYHFYTKGR